MKYLVTGATGFIGRNLIEAMQHDECELWALVRKNTDLGPMKKFKINLRVDENPEELPMFFKQHQFDGVIHLASLFLKDHLFNQIPDLISSNLIFATRVLDAAATNGVKWFLNTGTFWQNYEDRVRNPANLYAATKNAFEELAGYYRQTTPIVFTTLKLNDTFGKGDTRPKIINLLKRTADSGEKLAMSGGEQIMDISHVADVVESYRLLIQLLGKGRISSGEEFAVMSPERMTLKHLVEIFQKVSEKQLDIEWGKMSYRPRELMVPWSQGRNVPGFKPKKTLLERLKDFNS